jgi:hypothetical protein
MMGYALTLFCGENLAIFAASPSDTVTLAFWESDAFDDEFTLDDPFNALM